MNRILIFIIALGLSWSAVAGNSVGNGGDTLPEDRVSVKEYLAVLKLARRDVWLYLNYINLQHVLRPTPEFKAIFSARKSIFAVIKEVKLDIRVNAPCLDEAGRESDGNSVGRTNDSICISVQRLQKKLTHDNYIRQTLGLVAHELSHRVGFTEMQASTFQKAFVHFLQQGAGAPKVEPKYFGAMTAQMQNSVAGFRKDLRNFDGLDAKGLANLASSWMAGEQSRLEYEIVYQSRLLLFKYDESVWFRTRPYSDIGLLIGICHLYGICKDLGLSAETEKRYLLAFGSSNQMNVVDFGKAMSGSGQGPYYPYSLDIRKIQNREDIRAGITAQLSAAEFILQRYDDLYKMAN